MTLVRPSPVAGGAQRRGAAAAGLERGGVGVEAVGRVGDELDQRVDAVGVALANRRGDVAVARDEVGDAEAEQVVLVLGQRRGDRPWHPRTEASWTAKLPTPPVAPTIRTVSPSDGATASTSGERGDGRRAARRRRSATSTPAGFGAIDAVARARDQLGPRPRVDRRIGVGEEAEHLVARREAG